MNDAARFEIHVLSADDVSLMRAVNALFAEVFAEPENYASRPPSDAYLSELMASRSFIAVAALHDGAVVGALTAYDLPKAEQERREIYLYDLAVDARFRRQGVATALIACLQEIAGERGAHALFVQADYEDAPAVALYEKIGVREEVLHFDLPTVAARDHGRRGGRP